MVNKLKLVPFNFPKLEFKEGPRESTNRELKFRRRSISLLLNRLLYSCSYGAIEFHQRSGGSDFD